LKFKKFQNLKNCFLILLSISLICSESCKQDSVVTVTKNKVEIGNGKILSIVKTNKDTKSIGYFTGNNYGTSHRFTYTMEIEPDDIIWDGGSGEPKQIIYCNGTTYIRYLVKKSIRTESVDSITNEINIDYHNEVREELQQHVDKRYFFKLFGDDYWLNVPNSDLDSLQSGCKTFEIPNDNELSNPILY